MEDQISTIPKGWKMTTLGDVTKILSGSTPSTKESSYWDGEIPWITPKDLSGYSSVYISRGERNITNEGLKNSSAQILPKDTILFSSRAPIGYVVIAKNEVTTNQGFKNIICDEKNSHFKFFYYWLINNTEQIEKLSSGSTFSEASATVIRSLIVDLPELPEQRAIAMMLSSLDDKIELLREQNKTLEATAQAIFKEWFVNFNFPNATGKMIDSELGEIPAGWRVGKLGEFIDVRGGLSYDGNLISKKGTPMITMGFVSGDKRYEGSGIKYYSGQYNQQHQIKAGSLVIATRDVTQDRKLIGSPAIIPNYFGDITIIAATNLYIVQNINFLPNRFLYWVMRTPEYRERVIGACKGTTIVMITKDSILDYEFVIPKEELVEKFSAINESIFNRLELIDNQIQNLSALRDTLLPKLMKGEIRVREYNN